MYPKFHYNSVKRMVGLGGQMGVNVLLGLSDDKELNYHFPCKRLTEKA